MNSALHKIAVAIGFVLFVISLVTGLLRDVPLLSALFRALMVLMVSSVLISLFFQFFARVLYSFIEEQRRIQAAEAAKTEETKKQPDRKPSFR